MPIYLKSEPKKVMAEQPHPSAFHNIPLEVDSYVAESLVTPSRAEQEQAGWIFSALEGEEGLPIDWMFGTGSDTLSLMDGITLSNITLNDVQRLDPAPSVAPTTSSIVPNSTPPLQLPSSPPEDIKKESPLSDGMFYLSDEVSPTVQAKGSRRRVNSSSSSRKGGANSSRASSGSSRRSRKQEELEQMKEIAMRLAQQKADLEKQLRLTQYKQNAKKRARSESGAAVEVDDAALMKEMLRKEALLKKRKETLQNIWEAWNLGGADDMAEISDQVYHEDATLINPDLSRELRGREEIMAYWSTLINSFPDGIMLDFDIQEEDDEGSKFKISWTFSGTQVEPMHGIIGSKRKQISFPGRSYVTFKDDKIYQLVIIWNYREMLLDLLGIKLPQIFPS